MLVPLDNHRLVAASLHRLATNPQVSPLFCYLSGSPAERLGNHWGRMASYHHRKDRKNKPHQVRYRKADGQQGSQSYRTKMEAKEAQAKLTILEGKWLRGEDLPLPKRDVPTVEQWGDVWLAHHPVSGGTRIRYRSILNAWVYPQVGHIRLTELRPLDVGNMLAAARSAGRAVSTEVSIHQVLSLLLKYAQANGKVDDNVAHLVSLPAGRSQSKRKAHPFTEEELDVLIERTPPRWRLMCRFAATEGLRWGELMALWVRHVDLQKATVAVEQAVKADGKTGPTKSGRSRLIPLAASLVEPLTERLAGRSATDLVWGPFDRSRFRREVWLPSLEQADLTDHVFHDLRHTAASRLISRGASVKEVQEFLGHASATTTLNTYIHLFPGELDGLRGLLD